MVFAVLAIAAALAALGWYLSHHVRPATPVLNAMDPQNWEIGPANYPGGNPSRNMPLHPVLTGDGWDVLLARPQCEAHYVTMQCPPLAGKKSIRMDFRIKLSPGAKLVPVSDPNAPTILALYFQRFGDDWSAQGEYEAYRWYASFALVSPLQDQDYSVEAQLDANWTAVMSSSRQSNPTGFAAALANTIRVGFVLGGGTGLGHGVRVEGGTADIVVTNFQIQ